MTPLAALRPSAIVLSSFPALRPRRSFGSLSSFLPPPPPPPLKRIQEPYSNVSSSSSLGFCGKKGEDAFGISDEWDTEIYEFMAKSDDPTKFPSREQLIAAGRADLAEAIGKVGGWLAFGWHLVREGERWSQDGSLEAEDSRSSSARSMETKDEKEAVGIEGMLRRLEKARALSRRGSSHEREVNGRASSRIGADGGGDAVLIAIGKVTGSSDISRRSISSNLDELHNSGGVDCQKGTSADTSGMSSMPMWKIWSLQRSGSPTAQFEASEVFPDKEKHVNHNSSNDVSVDRKDVSVDETEVAGGVSRTDEESKGSHTDTKKIFQNQIHLRLKDMQSELTSSLHLIRSRSNGYVSFKDRESLKELHRLSDELEFKETEVMNAKDILQSTRVKLAIQQGKMTHARFEARRLDAAQKALHVIHTTCIIWPCSASEVLLAGSFDGWTSQRIMERSKSGIFTLHLKLYPGRYEIKFIVDGMWMVDRLRPTVWNNGWKNNLLLVP